MPKIMNLKKWGNGIGILLPKAILDMLTLKVNDEVEIKVVEDNIVISPVKRKHMTLAERFSEYEGETSQTEFWDDNPIGKEQI